MADENSTETVDEIEMIKEGLAEIEENPPDDTSDLSNGKKSTCLLCKHPACDQATEIYFTSNNNAEAVRSWFDSKFKRDFQVKTIEKHFKEHIEPFVQQSLIVREKKLDLIKERVARSEKSAYKMAQLKEIIWEFMLDVYVDKPDTTKTKEDRIRHESSSKELVELAKVFKDIYKLELEVLGYGKTEEEQIKMVKNYATSMIKNMRMAFNDMPEAQERLDKLLNMSTDSPVKRGDTDSG